MSFSQGRSGAALESYRRQQDTARRQPESIPSPAGPSPAAPQGQYQYPSRTRPTAPTADRSGWFNDRGWSPSPPAYYGNNRSFGVWDGLFLGALLSNLTRPGTIDFFHNNQNDPGYQQWRAEAERQAQDNADLRRRLDELDRQLAERDNQPRTPGVLPPDIPPEVAKATPSRTPDIVDNEDGSGWVWVVLVAGVGVFTYLTWRRRRPMIREPPMTRSSAGVLQSAGAMLRHKLSGESYTPSKFRVGMTLALDPTPFILAKGSIKVPQPEGSGQVSVSAVGHVVSGNAQLVRLYLPDGRSLVQLHLNAAGDPDECRLFGIIDEISPADPGEWSAWLDPNEGMIGWPVFQTKDGKIYNRIWIPGETPFPPLC